MFLLRSRGTLSKAPTTVMVTPTTPWMSLWSANSLHARTPASAFLRIRTLRSCSCTDSAASSCRLTLSGPSDQRVAIPIEIGSLIPCADAAFALAFGTKHH